MPKAEAIAATDCACGRIGYVLVLCQEHAPIPYELTPKGRREARRMRQWDAMFGSLQLTPRGRRLVAAVGR